jgi:hypothetical protein
MHDHYCIAISHVPQSFVARVIVYYWTVILLFLASLCVPIQLYAMLKKNWSTGLVLHFKMNKSASGVCCARTLWRKRGTVSFSDGKKAGFESPALRRSPWPDSHFHTGFPSPSQLDQRTESRSPSFWAPRFGIQPADDAVTESNTGYLAKDRTSQAAGKEDTN